MFLGPLATTSRRMRWCLGVVVGAVLLATLTPSAGSARSAVVWCVACGERGVADFVLNVILFAPLGALLRLAGVRRRTIVASCCALSLGIELSQEFIPGRETSLGDLIANTSGSFLGVLLIDAARGLLRHPRVAAITAVLCACLGVGAIALTGYLTAPDYPSTAYYGQWTADLGQFEWYRGQVVRATLGPMPVPSWRLPDQPGVHRLLASGAPLDLVVVAGPAPRRLAPIFSMADDRQQGILVIGPRGSDLIVQYRTRGLAWRLGQPYLIARGAFRDVGSGDTLHLTMWRQAGQLCVTRDTRRACPLGFTAGAGWSILTDSEDFPAWFRVLLGVAWTGGLFLAFGFSASSRTILVLGGALVVVGLGIVPAAAGLLPTPPTEWLGAAIGIVVGVALRARYRGVVVPAGRSTNLA